MKHQRLFLIFGAICALGLAAVADGQSLAGGDEIEAVEGHDLDVQLRERQEKISQLTQEEKAALGEARRKAMQDPAVKAALDVRKDAVLEFRSALQKSMLESDPSLATVFKKMATASRRR